MWRAAARTAYQEKKWIWGGRDEPNSIGDAEQLLTLLYPASVVPEFRLDRPDETNGDILDALRPLGDSVEIPRLLVRVLSDYMTTYTSEETGTVSFAGGSYFSPREPGDEVSGRQAALDVVDSYSMSVTLTLAALGFVRTLRSSVTRRELRDELDALEAASSRRLTAAMVGLLRSFAVNSFEPDSEPGAVLLRTVNQSGLPTRQVVERLRDALVDVRASLREVSLGSGRIDNLDNPNLLFECGWSWGVVADAPEVEDAAIGPQPKGYAQERPYLYFTVVALDGITDLFSERTRYLGLLDEYQQRLARALQIRWDLTQRYWSTIAQLGTERWPLEDLPWRTTDGEESDYYSLSVSAVTVQDLIRRRASDTELARVGAILTELGNRGRITRRPLRGDPAITLHRPGVRLRLVGAEELGPPLSWVVSDFSVVLLKRAVGLAGLARSTPVRDRLLALVDDIWQHVRQRRLAEGVSADLWDDPAAVFDQIPVRQDKPSWYYTERAVEALVLASDMVRDEPLRSSRLTDFATDLLNEADHLYSQELLANKAVTGPLHIGLQRAESSLRRARELLRERPGSATAVAIDVLEQLDDIAKARQDAARTS